MTHHSPNWKPCKWYQRWNGLDAARVQEEEGRKRTRLQPRVDLTIQSRAKDTEDDSGHDFVCIKSKTEDGHLSCEKTGQWQHLEGGDWGRAGRESSGVLVRFCSVIKVPAAHLCSLRGKVIQVCPNELGFLFCFFFKRLF